MPPRSMRALALTLGTKESNWFGRAELIVAKPQGKVRGSYGRVNGRDGEVG